MWRKAVGAAATDTSCRQTQQSPRNCIWLFTQPPGELESRDGAVLIDPTARWPLVGFRQTAPPHSHCLPSQGRTSPVGVQCSAVDAVSKAYVFFDLLPFRVLFWQVALKVVLYMIRRIKIRSSFFWKLYLFALLAVTSRLAEKSEQCSCCNACCMVN